MNKHILIPLVLFYLSIMSACWNENNDNNKPNQQIHTDTAKVSIDSPQTEHLHGTPVLLFVTTEYAILRSGPDIKSSEIGRKVKGDSLLFTNKISSFNTPIKIEGIAYNEPWLRVILQGNKMGWVYGGCINFKAAEHLLLKEKVLDQRAVTFFGQSLAKKIALYQKETQSTITLPAFRTLYSRAETLKDSLEKQMNIHLQTSKGSDLIDFFWLNELMNGILVHYIPEHQKYYLFRDLKYWQSISAKTQSTQDDNFIELLLAVYASDSIEYYFYDWQLMMDNQTMCSLLGSNIHSNVLDKMENALDSNGYFKNEILELKQAIIDDISIADHYWLSLESIQEELSAIIKRQYSFLASYDWVELKTRRQLLKKYKENKIEVNLFEGR